LSENQRAKKKKQKLNSEGQKPKNKNPGDRGMSRGTRSGRRTQNTGNRERVEDE